MSTKLSKKAKITRSVIAAVLAMLFAGSAASVLASAMRVEAAWAGLYFAAALAAALGLVGGVSGGGAFAAAGGIVAVSAVYAVGNASGLGALRDLFASWSGGEAEAAAVALWVLPEGIVSHPCDNRTFDKKGQRIIPNALVVKEL